MNTTFRELRCKYVINMVDGACLGHISDVCIDSKTGGISGFYVPVSQGGLSKIFGSNKQIFVPANNICRIGVDVILIEMYINPQGNGMDNTLQK
ncbi:MAG: YlmC/YmxH family sporulation protein [Clostridia bacterium]|nr:YlmC/YmxH family sporulation protein [Clostridia bacterium]